MKFNKNSLRVQLPLFTFIRLVSSTAYRMVYPFLPAFRDGLGVSVAALSVAIGARSLVAGLVGPFFAAHADSRGRRAGMLLGMLLFVAGTGVVVIWPTFPGLIAALMLTIIGKVTFDPTVQAYLGDRVPYERRSAVLTLTELSWSGAYIVGIPMVGWVIARGGWVAPFPLLGGLVVVSGAALLLTLPKDPPRDTSRPNAWANLVGVAKNRTAMLALSFLLFGSLANEIINLSFGVWMEASFGLQLTALGAAAAVLGAAELSGEGLVALATDKLGKRKSIVIGLVVNSLVVAALPAAAGSLTLALVVLFLFYISFEFMIVSSIPLMTEVMPAARATMMAGFFSFTSFGRALASWITPTLYGWSIWASVAAVIAANLIAIRILSRLQVRK
ncbi:MAG: MFS transporter [Chloroflexi bacterium]|nr:MFS transporter [Chloroflexota bacterium]